VLAGKQCDVWVKVEQNGGKTNTYTMWVASDDQTPVRYEMMGFDSLLGSHYDKYVLDYNMYNNEPIPESVFDPPKSKFPSLNSLLVIIVNSIECVSSTKDKVSMESLLFLM